MEGILKVTPEKLIASAGEFGSIGTRIRGLTEEMMNNVNSMKAVWMGEAADAYSGRFLSLQSDMDKMHRMIQEHVTDLQEMAQQYQIAETANAEEASALANNIIA